MEAARDFKYVNFLFDNISVSCYNAVMKIAEPSVAKRIREMRLAKNLSQACLAARAGMLPAQLCKIESGKNRLNGSSLARLASALDVTIACLLGEDGRLPARSARRRRGSNATDFLPLLACGAERECEAALEEVCAWERTISSAERRRGLTVRSSLQLTYPYGFDERAADLSARDLRTSIGMGREPALNLSATLERAGVRVVMVKGGRGFASASYCNPAGGTFSIALNAGDTRERNSYRLAYELGAAVAFAANGWATVEDAGAVHRFIRNFASAFLMPEETVRAEVASLGIRPEGWTMEALVFVKERFGVSAESFALRLEALGLITPSLRGALRDELRARYAEKPDDMEPHPPANQTRLDVMKDVKEKINEV